MDLLALAAASEEPGVIIQEGKVPTDAELAKLTGIRKSTLQACIKDLERRGVFSRDRRGAIYSRRMVREASEYRANVAIGAKGGNPMLLGDGVAANPVQTRSKDVADLQQTRTDFAEDLQQDCAKVPSVNNRVASAKVIPPVKTDLDSDKEEGKKRGNRSRFPCTDGAKVVSIETARKTPRRRGTEFAKPDGAAQQIADEDRALQLWNMLAAVSHVASGTMAADRRAKLRSRLREIGGLEAWQRALKAVELSPLWQGREGRGWKPTFDDILSRDKLRKLLEGGYPAETRSRPAGRRVDPNADLYRKHGLAPAQDPDQGGLTLDMVDDE